MFNYEGDAGDENDSKPSLMAPYLTIPNNPFLGVAIGQSYGAWLAGQTQAKQE